VHVTFIAATFLSPLVALSALVVTITGVVALVRDKSTWLRFGSRKRAVIWTVAAGVAFFVVGGISAAVLPTDRSASSSEPVAVASATPTPASVPSAITGLTAASVLSTLEVKGRAPKTGYDRDRFGRRWSDVDRNGCDTRNDILARDLADLARSGACTVIAGTLADPFTGTSMDFVRGQGTSELVQIDHVVSLSDAWQKGAQQLTDDQRATFANDPLNLLAVNGKANAQKGDGDAATWLPSNTSFRCAYVARQVAVKASYGLWVTAAERDAIARVLEACPDEPVPTSVFAAHAPAPAQPSLQPSTFYADCDAARAAGDTPLYASSPGYSRTLDGDGDGVACE
jgi:hypothetical protein